ncbi:MAG TPA: nuclear transport factor 2 family protein, partial [Pirellulales bacterium]
MRTSVTKTFLAALLLAASIFVGIAVAQQPANRAADEAAIHQAGKDYLAAMEKGDAKAIAEFWTADGTYTDDAGQTVKARDQIQKTFTGKKSSRPPTTVSNTSIRFLTGDVAIEEGDVANPALAGSASQAEHFTAMWVKQSGKWKLDNLRDTRQEASAGMPAANAASEMAALEPMIGQWSGTSGKMTMQTTAKWNPTKTFIRRDLTVSSEGKTIFSGSQQIGWDAASQTIKSWSFNDDGSTSNGVWSIDGRTWIEMTAGLTADGRSSSNTQEFKFTDKNTLDWRLFDGKVGDQTTPDMEFKLARAASTPAGGKETKSTQSPQPANTAKAGGAATVTPLPIPGESAADAAKRAEILNSDRWKKVQKEFQEWLSMQVVYTPQQVEKMRAKLNAEINKMSAAELQQFLDQWDAKLKVLLGKDAGEVREWLGEYMSVIADGYRPTFLKKLGITDVSTLSAAQIEEGLDRIRADRLNFQS